MNESEFHALADRMLEAIQDAIDDSGADIDYEQAGGVLTLEFENGSKIIFSKQPPMMQLWMAAQAGGFHFDYHADRQRWLCDSGDHEELYAMLSRLASQQGGQIIHLSSP